MPTVLCISSHIVRGRVGNSIAVPALELLGIETWSLPTVLLSETPGTGEVSGGALPEQMFDGLLSRAQGWAPSLDAVQIGYLRTEAQVKSVGKFIAEARRNKPDLLVAVDPIMGDTHTGLYVPEAVAAAIAGLIVPQASLITPNAWELSRLAGMPIKTPSDVLVASSRLPCPSVLCTSAPAGSGEIANMLCENNTAMVVRTPRHAQAPHGTGDLLAALFLAHLLRGEDRAHALALASASLFATIAASDGRSVLPVIERPELLRAPPQQFAARFMAGTDGSPWVLGADGCRGGWLAVLVHKDDREEPRAVLCKNFAELLALPEKPNVIALDVPIGLPGRAVKGGRLCCNLARSKLGERQSSVFSVPARAVLGAKSYLEACEINLTHSDPPRKIAKQTFNILPRIAEVDALMTRELQRRVFECHPEFAFTQMNGDRPLGLPKKVKNRPYKEGMALRRRLLKAASLLVPQAPAPRDGITYGEDDLLDACACAFAARRIARGEAIRLPPDPPLDEKGLRMEIIA